ncbi:hypothetical protein THER5_1945 [Bifidobacterium thermacidophilum subsp. thermacidophilum]|uniref:Uncharacterized protein n=1 Tax=Bifidobacterium thermacidophilum subsp. thermacidophilum TaxID=79262 RepID=A0A087E1E1_9BIFI|nr:hypothetical protein THER5_1945 [Bifidobacterium thermacidophilum subsp. thermacidophilum]
MSAKYRPICVSGIGCEGCVVGCVAVLGLLVCGFGPGRHGCLKPARTCCDARCTCEFGMPCRACPGIRLTLGRRSSSLSG